MGSDVAVAEQSPQTETIKPKYSVLQFLFLGSVLRQPFPTRKHFFGRLNSNFSVCTFTSTTRNALTTKRTLNLDPTRRHNQSDQFREFRSKFRRNFFHCQQSHGRIRTTPCETTNTICGGASSSGSRGLFRISVPYL